jgi:hypothetical protein
VVLLFGALVLLTEGGRRQGGNDLKQKQKAVDVVVQGSCRLPCLTGLTGTRNRPIEQFMGRTRRVPAAFLANHI